MEYVGHANNHLRMTRVLEDTSTTMLSAQGRILKELKRCSRTPERMHAMVELARLPVQPSGWWRSCLNGPASLLIRLADVERSLMAQPQVAQHYQGRRRKYYWRRGANSTWPHGWWWMHISHCWSRHVCAQRHGMDGSCTCGFSREHLMKERLLFLQHCSFEASANRRPASWWSRDVNEHGERRFVHRTTTTEHGNSRCSANS